jgi:uroporphyrinogen-III synthase
MSVLSGLVIAFPETRALVAIVDAADPAPVDAWLGALAAGGFDDVIFLTGEGVRRLVARARAIGREEAVVAALRRVRRITRGPKPAQALRELGLATDVAAQPPTSDGVIATLVRASPPLAGRRVGVQLYGTEPNEPLMRALREAGAAPHAVAPYAYASASDEDRVAELIAALDAGRLSLIVFTSAAQLAQLTAVAERRGLAEACRRGLLGTPVAAIGPVAVEALGRIGVTPAVVPDPPFVMKRLSKAIARWASAARSPSGAPPGGATRG